MVTPGRTARRYRSAALVASASTAALLGAAPEPPTTIPATPIIPAEFAKPVLRPFTQAIDGTAITFEMRPVPGTADVKPFWLGKTEVTWDMYDAFLFRLDGSKADATEGADAVTRPSKPYISMDRGFGHSGYAAISMSAHGAKSFCEWLSKKTGRRYRLPTEAEWRQACATGGLDPAAPDAHAWHRGNADFKTQPVGKRTGDANGIHDLWGNAAEWVIDANGGPVTMGGSYRDRPDAIGCAARVEPKDAWNASDPQIPKSIWWLADAGFIGFRVVCEAPG